MTTVAATSPLQKLVKASPSKSKPSGSWQGSVPAGSAVGAGVVAPPRPRSTPGSSSGVSSRAAPWVALHRASSAASNRRVPSAGRTARVASDSRQLPGMPSVIAAFQAHR